MEVIIQKIKLKTLNSNEAPSFVSFVNFVKHLISVNIGIWFTV